MATKPLVIHIERGHTDFNDDHNEDRDALRYFLRKHCGCEVAEYDYADEFKRDWQQFLANDQLILVIVEEFARQHVEISKLVKEQFGDKVPVLVLPDRHHYSNEDRQDSLDLTLDHLSPELPKMIINLSDDWRSKHGVPKEEVEVRKSKDNPDYQIDLDKIRQLDHHGRRAFVEVIDRSSRARVGRGENVQGFAIDFKTLQICTTDGFGMHNAAADFLVDRLMQIELLMLHDKIEELNFREIQGDCWQRILRGYVFTKVEGIKIPIILPFDIRFFDDRPDHCEEQEEFKENLRRVANFLQRQQEYILIDHKGNIIEG